MPEQEPEELDPDRQHASAYQHSWMDIIDEVRTGLTVKVKEIPVMCATDILNFMTACQGAFWLEHHIRLTDKHLEDGRNKTGSYES